MTIMDLILTIALLGLLITSVIVLSRWDWHKESKCQSKKIFFIQSEDVYMTVSMDNKKHCKYILHTDASFVFCENDSILSKKIKSKKYLSTISTDSGWKTNRSYNQLFHKDTIILAKETSLISNM